MQPFVLASEVERRYADYVRTAFPFADPELRRQVEEKIGREQLLSTGPILSLQRPFARGTTIGQLEAVGDLHPSAAEIFTRAGITELRSHQRDAFGRLCDARGAHSTIVATGTGSGKTEAFLLPIVDYCIRHPGEGVKALLVYPMNALANDQLERLRRYLQGTGITFARYTGDTPAEQNAANHPGVLPPGEPYRMGGPIPAEECFSRAEIRRQRPNLLITSYRMLEYLLVRREDQRIFRPGGAPSLLRYLVMDEVHTYTGSLGAEVACLIRRLRGHLGLAGPALVCVGTSATVGDDQRDDVLRFAGDLFAVPFDGEGLIGERYEERSPGGAREVPALSIDGGMLERLGCLVTAAEGEMPDPETLSALDAVLGRREWPSIQPALSEELARLLRDHPLIAWLEETLAEPRPLSEVVQLALERRWQGTADLEAVRRVITAFLILGTYARDADGPLLRPRLHVFYRGLSHATRCTLCGEFLPNGDPTCSRCQGRALPLEICRTCGQDYLRAAFVAQRQEESDQATSGLTRAEHRDELHGASAATVRLTKALHSIALEEEPEDEDDEGAEDGRHGREAALRRVVLCSACGFLDGSPESGTPTECAHCSRGPLAELLLAKVGSMRACVACNGTWGVGQEAATPLASGTAVGTSILTWLVMGNLPSEERRLLIFADSRQDTAYQAGYLRDITAAYAWRQLTYRLVTERVEGGQTPYDLNGFWNGLYDTGRRRFRIFGKENPQQQKDDLRWFVVQEFSRASRRRMALEALGLVGVEYAFVDELPEQREFAAFRRAASPVQGGRPFSDAELSDVLQVVLDLMRRSGAVSDDFACRFWGTSEAPRGVDQYNRRPTAYRREGTAGKSGYAEIKAIVSRGAGSRSAIESYLLRLGIADPKAAAKAAASVLTDEGLLAEVDVGGHYPNQRADGVLSVNHARLALVRPARLWRCANCGTTHTRNVRDLCTNRRCPGSEAGGTLRPIAAADKANFYVAMYRDLDPIRIEAREHSSQLSGTTRIEYENAFKRGDVNVLVASPTLELGVDIGGLSTVLLRGLPPSPSNYTQRAGRAGRAERIAVVNAYAQSTPHDAHFYRHPEAMISGHIAAPSFDLDNREIVRRHIRSLALEKLEHELPTYMQEFLDVARVESQSPEAYAASRLEGPRGLLDEMAGRRAEIMRAVISALGDERRTWLSSEFIEEVLEKFGGDLTRVLDAWHAEVIEVAAEIARINESATPTGDEKRRRGVLERTLESLTRPTSNWDSGRAASYTLAYLAEHGFLPSYAFPGEAATLLAPDVEGGELTRDPIIALSEFAPANVVYVDGKKVLCDGFMLERGAGAESERGPSDERANYYHCSRCGYHALRAWVGSCPQCQGTETAVSQPRLAARHFRGRQEALIGASEEARERKLYQVDAVLVGDPAFGERYDYEHAAVSSLRRQRVMFINSGRHTRAGVEPFEICMRCGDAKIAGLKGDWDALHEKRRRHKPNLHSLVLTHEIESDVVAIRPRGVSDAVCLTLRYALISASQLMFDTAENEIGGFERPSADGDMEVVLYERTSGGAGYVRRLAAQLPAVASRALDLLRHDPPCNQACYACLLSYYNQRDHEKIDKRLVLGYLESLAAEVCPAPVPLQQHVAPAPGGDGNGFSPILEPDTDYEEILIAELRKRGISGLLPQYAIHEPDTGALVSKPDVAFPSARLAIYVDGLSVHDTPEGRAHDTRVRTRVRDLGWIVKVFPNRRVVRDLDGCIEEITRVLSDR